MTTGEDYHPLAPELTDDTEAIELVEYCEERVENPIEIDGTRVYHFNSHTPDLDAMEHDIKTKLNRDIYVVPFQAYSGWSFMMLLLPEQIREAEWLIYRPKEQEYYAYKNYIRGIPEEMYRDIRQDLAREVMGHV